MKKVISIVMLLLILVVALWGGATYWFGVKTEERYRALIEQASPWQVVQLSNESYSRGFLRSKARTIVEFQRLPDMAAENQPMRLILESDIAHGPFPLRQSPNGKGQFRPVMAIIETGIVVSPDARDRLAELFTQIPELASVRDCVIIDLDGGGEERLLIPAFQHTFGDEDKAAVDWKGLSFQLNFTGDLKGFSGWLTVPGLEAVAKDLNLRLTEVKTAFNSHEGINGLFLGEASFDLGGLEMDAKQEGEHQAFLIRSFTANTSSKASGDNINCVVAMRTDHVKVNETSYGPAIFEMQLRNLDAASVASLQDAAGEIQAQSQGQSTERLQSMMLSRLGEILPDLLKKSPEIEISQLEVKTTEGDFVGKAKIAVDGTKLDSTPNLVTLASALTAQAEFKVGEHLLRRVASELIKDRIIAESNEQHAAPGNEKLDAIAFAAIEEQLKALVAQIILVKDNGNYGATATYKAGRIVLNGRPLSLQDLIK